jgi:hypothetical protein
MLSDRDLEILDMLSLRTRLASLSQLARTWWQGAKGPRDACDRRLVRLGAAGLLVRVQVNAIAIPPLTGPLIRWSPGDSVPDFGALAWQLHQRWKAPIAPTTVFLATSRCAGYFGGRRRGRLSHAFQLSHDLGVTETFLALRLMNIAAVKCWIDEDRLAPARRGQKLSDALIARDVNAPLLVLEFGGNYPKSRLQDFHDDNESRGLPYQIW